MATTAFTLGVTLLGSAYSAPLEVQEITIPGTVASFRLVKIPAGTVDYNGEPVEVKSLWVGETEVLWDVYDIYAFRLDQTPEEQAANKDAESRPSRPYGAVDRGYGHAGFAALGMTRLSAAKFCEWLSAKTGKNFRLPTEAEWEYFARAGSEAPPADLGSVAWYAANSNNRAKPAASLAPNPWGLYDVLGNVAEWTEAADHPVIKGGHFRSETLDFSWREFYNVKWQERDSQRPKSRWWLSDAPFIGLRVVMEE